MEVMSSSCSTSTFHPNFTKQTPPTPRLSSSIKPASTPLRFPPPSRSLRLRLDRRDAGIAVASRGAAVPWCSAAGIPEKVGPFERKRLAVFVSGGGSNFRSIHEAALKGEVRGDVAVLVTDKPSCGGAKYAAENGIPTLLFPKSKSSVDGMSAVELVASLRQLDIDFVLLAGFLKLIPVELVQAFPRSILNIHPSLLPSFGGKGFYGAKVHQAVIASGARYSGPTIHFVDEHYDTGCILAQRVVPVLAIDTPEELAKRVLHEEHKLYVHVVAALCEGRIFWRDDGVPLIQNKENPNEYS